MADPLKKRLQALTDPRRRRGPAFLCGQRPRFLPPPRGVLPSPPFSFRRRSRHGVIERRAASAAFDAGSPWVGRPESIQSKGDPAAPRAVGNKENGPLARSKRENARGSEGYCHSGRRGRPPGPPTKSVGKSPVQKEGVYGGTRFPRKIARGISAEMPRFKKSPSAEAEGERKRRKGAITWLWRRCTRCRHRRPRKWWRSPRPARSCRSWHSQDQQRSRRGCSS